MHCLVFFKYWYKASVFRQVLNIISNKILSIYMLIVVFNAWELVLQVDGNTKKVIIGSTF